MSRTLIYLCFFLSGASGLIYEIVWSRLLVRLLGASLYAVAAVTAIFLAGLAIGAALPALLSRCRLRLLRLDMIGADTINGGTAADISSLRLYALLELLVAVAGCCMPAVFASDTVNVLNHLFAGDVWWSYLVRVIVAAGILLPPTCLMGLSFPLLIKAGWEQRQQLQSEMLYTVNTAGAAIGAGLAGFVLLPMLGLSGTSWLAAGLNALAAVLAWLLASRMLVPSAIVFSGSAVHTSSMGSEKGNSKKVVLTAAFAGGFCAIAFEVVWTRFFSLLLGSSIYSFSSVLVVFLLGMALSAWLVVRWLVRLNQPLIIAAAALTLSTVYTLALLFAVNELPWFYLSIVGKMIADSGRLSFEASMLARLVIVVVTIGPPSIALGMVLPLLFSAAGMPLQSAKGAGLIYAINTGGGICGALFAGFVAIPELGKIFLSGIQAFALLLCGVQLCLAGWLFIVWCNSFVRDKASARVVNGVVVFVLVAIVLDIAVFPPVWNPRIMSAGASFYTPADVMLLTHADFLRSIGVNARVPGNSARIMFYRDGLNATVTVDRNASGSVVYLKNDGKVEAALPTSLNQLGPFSDISTHVLLGGLPILFHPGPCNSALVIGFGSGTTSGAMLAFPEVKQLDVAEIEPAIFSSSVHFADINNNPLAPQWINSGRVHKLVQDGRFVVSTSGRSYDVIVSQPADPWVNGASELFTSEFWRAGRSALKSDGVFCQWIQLYSISPAYFGMLCRTFNAVFPDAMLMHSNRAGECLLLGFKSGSAVSRASLERRLAAVAKQPLFMAAALTGYDDLQRLTRMDSQGIKNMGVDIAQGWHDARINTDDNLIVEYACAKNSMTQAQNIENNIKLIEKFARQ